MPNSSPECTFTDLFDLFKSENHIHSKISYNFSFRFLNINCFQVLVVITFKATSVAILIPVLYLLHHFLYTHLVISFRCRPQRSSFSCIILIILSIHFCTMIDEITISFFKNYNCYLKFINFVLNKLISLI